MSLVPNPRPDSGRTPETAPMPVGQLLIWAAAHSDKTIRSHAEKARTSLESLRARYTADTELARIDGEAARLEKQLEVLRARKAELNPPKTPRKTPSYSAAAVRAWARENGITAPERGRVPTAVVDAWKAATSSDEGQQ